MDNVPKTPSQPVILLAYEADLPEDEELARNLAEERRRLRAALHPLERKRLIKVVLRTDVTATLLAQTLRKYRHNVAILHYGGHSAGSAQLLTRGEPGESDYQPLSVLLEGQSSLQLFFVSGCLSESLAGDLLQCGAPIVAGSLATCTDNAAIAFAEHFYAELAAGSGLEAAYRQAEATLKLSLRMPASAYHSDAAAAADIWPWLLRSRPGAAEARAWNIPAAAGDYLFNLPSLPLCPLSENPYHKALAWYGRQEADIFFGRGRQIRKLYQRLTDGGGSPLVLLSGQSGVGKSSLLEAGLIPRLEAGAYDVCYTRRDAATGMGATLRHALALPPAAPDADLPLAWRDREQRTGRPLILILDQVEEIFTRALPTASSEMEAWADICQSLFAVPGERPRGRLLLSFRKEYLPEIEEPLRRRNLDLTHLLLERLDEAGIVEVVRGPTTSERLQAKYNLQIEPGLAERIARDLSEDVASPIATILQILLTEMWERARGKAPDTPLFDAALYAELCSAGIFLTDFFRQRVAEFSRRQPDVVASGLLLDLLDFHTTRQGAAQQRSLTELEEQYGSHRPLPQIIQLGKELRLLADPTGDRPESQDGDAAGQVGGARLAHDTLAPIVRGAYLTSTQPGQRARRILESRIGDWKAMQTPKQPPLNPRDLEAVEAGLWGMRLPLPEEQALIAASRRERAKARRLEWLLKGAGLAALCAIVALAIAATWFGYSAQANAAEVDRQRQTAETSAAEAQQQREAAVKAEATAIASAEIAEREQALAESARFEAESNLQLAQEQQALAEANARRSKANELANDVDELLARPAYDISLALLLAQAAVASTWDIDGFVTANAEAALQRAVDAVQNIGWQRTLPAHRHTDVVNTVIFRPDGGAVLSGSADQSLRLWDGASGRQLALLAGHVGPVISAAFAPSGDWLVSGGDDGRILLWYPGRNAGYVTLAQTSSWVRSLAVRADGALIAAGMDAGTVLLLAPQAEAASQELAGHMGKVNSVAFAPGVGQLATGGADGTIRLWDTATGTPIAILPGHAGETKWVGYAGDYLYSAGDDGSIKQWDAATGLQIADHQLDAGGLRSAAISTDGKYMASVHVDSSVRVWLLADPHSVVHLKGHEDATLTVAFSPDGTLLATGGEDKSVRIWNHAAEEELPGWGGHTGEVRTAIFSPDDRILLTTGHDGTVRVWDVGDGRLRDILRSQSRERVMNRYAAFSPDGSRVVIGADDGAVRLWKLGGGVSLCIPANGKAVYSTVFSPDAAAILIAGAEGNLRLVDAARCRQLQQFTGHTGTVRSAFFDSTGSRILSAGDDGAVRIWSVETGRELVAPFVHPDWVLQATFSPDGMEVATGSRDRMLRIWDAASGALLAELGPHAGEVRSVAYSPDGRLLAAADNDGSTWLWNVADRRLVRKLLAHDGNVRFVTFSRSGAYLATAGIDGSVRIWAVEPQRQLRTLSAHHESVRSVVFSPDGSMIATAGVDGAAILWDAATGRQLRKFDGEGRTIWSLAFAHDGQTLLGGCDDGYVRVWRLDAEQPQTRFKVSAEAVRTIALSTDGALLATGGKDRVVRIWDANKYTTIRLYAEGSSTILAAAFHPAGTFLATAGEDGRISIWDTQSARKLRTIADPSGWVWALAYSPDGRQLAAGGRDGSVRSFDATSGSLLREVDSENGLVAAVVFSPDGNQMFSAGEDGPIRIWNSVTGERIRQLGGHTAGVWSLALSPDGQTLVSAGADQTARLWQADVETTLVAAEQMLQREPPLFLPVEQELYSLPPVAR